MFLFLWYRWVCRVLCDFEAKTRILFLYLSLITRNTASVFTGIHHQRREAKFSPGLFQFGPRSSERIADVFVSSKSREHKLTLTEKEIYGPLPPLTDEKYYWAGPVPVLHFRGPHNPRSFDSFPEKRAVNIFSVVFVRVTSYQGSCCLYFQSLLQVRGWAKLNTALLRAALADFKK